MIKCFTLSYTKQEKMTTEQVKKEFKAMKEKRNLSAFKYGFSQSEWLRYMELGFIVANEPKSKKK